MIRKKTNSKMLQLLFEMTARPLGVLPESHSAIWHPSFTYSQRRFPLVRFDQLMLGKHLHRIDSRGHPSPLCVLRDAGLVRWPQPGGGGGGAPRCASSQCSKQRSKERSSHKAHSTAEWAAWLLGAPKEERPSSLQAAGELSRR